MRDGFRVAADDFVCRDRMPALSNALCDTGDVDLRTVRADEEQPDKEIRSFGTMKVLNLVGRRKDGFERKAGSVDQTFLALEICRSGCLQRGVGGVPVTEFVLSDDIGLM